MKNIEIRIDLNINGTKTFLKKIEDSGIKIIKRKLDIVCPDRVSTITITEDDFNFLILIKNKNLHLAKTKTGHSLNSKEIDFDLYLLINDSVSKSFEFEEII